MSHEHLALSSEIKELESILASIPQENVIERLAFEERLASARTIFNSLSNDLQRKKANLTFRGHPVFGSHGIAADFGTKAAGAFADAFAAVVAGLNESLGYMGPIPDKEKNQLLITGTAIGSFGFEFELPSQQDDLFPEPCKMELALEKMQELLRVSAEGSDDEVTELVEAIHPRAVKKVVEFLGYLAQQQAWCGLEFKDQFFRYQGIEQLQISVERLQEDNIHERDEEYTGEFQGILPNSRTFEFKLTDQRGILKGNVDIAIEDPDLLNREWLHKPVNLKLHVIQVGKGRPRFTLPEMSAVRLRGT
ncbi:hypothetical protein [Collimonas antrihumi]|uniref:hypothetical protein n=1 Tax=Collimonas antrihumi TaxID=1940615 RepID=UPI001B8BAFCB|nr:hypothetical protein [Collimonas antrihumi]